MVYQIYQPWLDCQKRSPPLGEQYMETEKDSASKLNPASSANEPKTAPNQAPPNPTGRWKQRFRHVVDLAMET